MSNIKLKAFHLKNKTIYPVRKIEFNNPLNIYTLAKKDKTDLVVDDTETTILQFTNYSDNNNIEIYEGDIFQWAKDSYGIVSIVKGQWVFSNNNGYFSVNGYCKDGVVVGNFYTDIDLLNHQDLVNITF